MKTYQNYHRHSCYTNVRVPDSTVTNQSYADRAIELGHQIISSCEHSFQGNYYEVQKIAKASGLKPLIAAEAYWVRNRFEADRSNCHIFLGAKTERGRQALNDALSEANISGFYFQPRLDIPLILSLPKDDIICTSACVAGWKYDDADEIMLRFAEHFGKNFYFEVQYHNTPSQIALNQRILKLHNEHKIPLIMGCDSHFIYPNQAQERSDFLASKGIEYPEEDGWYLDYPDGDEAYRRFANQCVLSHQEIVDAMDNTNVFLDIEPYENEIFCDNMKLPSLPIHREWTQEMKDSEYKRVVWSGWEKYRKAIPQESWPIYEAEINKEMQTVIDTKMADYFLLDYAVMKKGKENGGRLTKSGRGSGASFFTNTLLGFSDIDRVNCTIHMFPERFMSTERILQSKAIPDIDMNEAPTEPFVRAQAEVLGQDHSYPMIAYGTMKTSAAWKLYAKSQGVPFEAANKISEQIKRYELALKHADEDEAEEVKIEKYISKDLMPVFQGSLGYQGLISSWSIAPCSSLIYSESIRKNIGLIKIKDNLCCLMDGHWAEEGHFLKNDHLKVSVVDLIYDSYKAINMEPPSVKELLDWCTPDDPVWDIYAKGCTVGINQCSREGTTARLMKFKPRNIAELTAFVAAIRPGFASLYKRFEAREHYQFGIPSLDAVIQTREYPESFLLYQESIMAVLNYAGIPMADCYTAIKNIAKKRAEKVLAYKETFSSGMLNRLIGEGYDKETIETVTSTIWTTIEDAASYSFNASHAYCVAIDSLYSAWVKAHHPLQFYQTYIAIQEEKGDKDEITKAKAEAESYFGIRFLPLKFRQDNRSLHIDTKENAFINTMASIKGYGSRIGQDLYQAGKYSYATFIDLLDALDQRGIKEAKYRPLILINYFEEFGNQRELLEIARAWEFFKHGDCISVKKELLDQSDASIVSHFANGKRKDGKEATAFSFSNRDDTMMCMRTIEAKIRQSNLPQLDIHLQVKNSIEILGYANIITGKEEDRRLLLIEDVVALKSTSGEVWAYRVGTKSLGSGKGARVTVRHDLFDKHPISVGDILYAENLYKNPVGYWYLTSYRHC